MSHLKPVRRIEMAKGQLPSEIAGGVFHILPRRITLPRHLIFTLVTWLMLTLLLPMGPLMTASPPYLPTRLLAAAQSGFCEYVSEIPQAECEALVAFYNHTNGPYWSRSTGWLDTTTPCSWDGVMCRDGHVTGLELFTNQLSGSIPSELGDLSHLTYLGLASNDLSGPIPPELGKLGNLNMLILYSNQLTGDIPVELGDLANLTHLRLYNNQLSGSIPGELGNLTILTDLVLKSNQLRGSIPPELSNLTDLRVLYLSYNQLSGEIPATLLNLVNLGRYSVDIGYNMLKATDPAVVAFLDEEDHDWAQTQTVPPMDVHVTAMSSTAVDLAWRPISYTVHGGYYEVSHAITVTGSYTSDGIVADKTADSYHLQELSPCSGCYLHVRTHTPAHGQQQNDLWSDYTKVAVWPLPPPTITAPVGNVFISLPTFRWERLGGAISYDIQVDDDPGFTSPVISDTALIPSYTPSSTLPAGNYSWRVRGSNFCGGGEFAVGQFRTPRTVIYLPLIHGYEGAPHPTLQYNRSHRSAARAHLTARHTTRRRALAIGQVTGDSPSRGKRTSFDPSSWKD